MKVESVNLQDLVFEVSFTAPGDDGDMGKSDRYDIAMMSNPVTLLYEQNDGYKKPKNFKIPESLHLPFEIVSSKTLNEYGNKEHFKIKLNRIQIKTNLVSIKIRAIDKNENKGEWSHVVSIKLDSSIELADGIQEYERIVNLIKSPLTGNNDPNYVSKREKHVIISLVLVAVAMLVAFGSFLLIYKIRKYKPKEQKKLDDKDAAPLVRRV